MTDIALELRNVYKKFRRGERHDSLRDLLPALAKRTMQHVVRTDNLRPEEFWALQDISCSIRKGEAVGIIGHNGAGKSTILKLLSGIMRPTSGNISVLGRLSALIEVGAGFHQDLTGRENVYLNGVILGMTRAEVQRKFDEIVDFSGLKEFIDTPVKRYSSGMYARLGFSVAAHLEPDVLIVDEVLSVGDYVFQAKSLEKMRAVLRGGATVIFVSHNLRAMADLCDRALLLDKGQLIEDGPTSRVIHTYMERNRLTGSSTDEKDVYIESVSVGSADGPRFDYQSGERAFVEVRIRANRPTARVACVVYIMDSNYYKVFQISSERLGRPSLDLSTGETASYVFSLDLHLTTGNYQLCVILFRHDIGLRYDQAEPAATLLVSSPIHMLGVANLYPRLVE